MFQRQQRETGLFFYKTLVNFYVPHLLSSHEILIKFYLPTVVKTMPRCLAIFTEQWRVDNVNRDHESATIQWHSAGSLGWPFPILKYEYFFSNKICGSNFVKHHSETVMFWNYQNVDCSLRKKFFVSLSLIIIFGTLSFPIADGNRPTGGKQVS